MYTYVPASASEASPRRRRRRRRRRLAPQCCPWGNRGRRCRTHQPVVRKSVIYFKKSIISKKKEIQGNAFYLSHLLKYCKYVEDNTMRGKSVLLWPNTVFLNFNWAIKPICLILNSPISRFFAKKYSSPWVRGSPWRLS